ncbi:MAG: tRNA uridine-5-carboxymethylaminomethyl(34) synthesis GTPase MnmE [Amaricoccus sp.]
MDTIFAQATAPGRAGIAVVRISGPRAFEAVAALAPPPGAARTAVLRWLVDPASGEPIDQALVVFFAAPASFTGEDVAELHLHGSPAVVRGVLAALAALPGLRAAEPGEFTRRALLNDRLDLAQVEGLGDLLAAETAAQRRQAVALMRGVLSGLVEGWRGEFLGVLALVEATIDFADEELPPDLIARLAADVSRTVVAMEAEVSRGRVAERVREGFEVALVGRPNVGKSTLLNALAGRDVALTSAVAGTTRDVLEVRVDLGGLALTLLDTAGLRDSCDPVEGMGVARARDRAAAADLRVFLVDDPKEAAGLGMAVSPDDLVVVAKADLRDSSETLAVSGVTGYGIDDLLNAIGSALRGRVAAAGTLSHERQRAAAAAAAAAGAAALKELERSAPRVELAAEELRRALRELDFLDGKVDVEAVLDVIFASFCIGK